MKVDFFAFLPPGQHPGMDALARGLALGIQDQRTTAVDGDANEIALRLRCHATLTAEHLQQAVQEGANAIFLFITQPHLPPVSVVQDIMQAGCAVYTIHRPWYPVTGCVVVPNFYQGVTLANRLAQAIQQGNAVSAGAPSQKIAILGGPNIVDDEELVLGCLDGAKRAQLVVLNDPFQTQYRNLHDVKGVSRAAVERMFEDFGHVMDGLIVFNDETLYDVIAFLRDKKDNSWLGRLPIVSRNGSPAAIEYVRQGWTTATLDYHLPEIGRLAADLLQDNTAACEFIAPLGTLYDTENVDDYVSWEVRAPPLDDPFVVLSNDMVDTGEKSI